MIMIINGVTKKTMKRKIIKHVATNNYRKWEKIIYDNGSVIMENMMI